MSNPSISKQTLPDWDWPGLHILYVWNKYGSATSSVFNTISFKRYRPWAKNTSAVLLFNSGKSEFYLDFAPYFSRVFIIST